MERRVIILYLHDEKLNGGGTGVQEQKKSKKLRMTEREMVTLCRNPYLSLICEKWRSQVLGTAVINKMDENY